VARARRGRVVPKWLADKAVAPSASRPDHQVIAYWQRSKFRNAAWAKYCTTYWSSRGSIRFGEFELRQDPRR